MLADKKRSRPRTRRSASSAVEMLESRALLSPLPTYPGYGPTPTPVTISPMPTPTPTVPVTMTPTPTSTPTPTPTPTPTASQPPKVDHTKHGQNVSGIVTKTPDFNKLYKGPKLAELNAVRASAQLSADGSTFTFSGTTAGKINKAPAVYIWGLDRNGNLPPGPFGGHPNVKFDAVVVVSLNSSLTPTASVTDLASGTTTALPAGSASISGRTVSVSLAASLLPSTGLAPSQYRFNYWPEDGMSPDTSAVVASFLPATNNAQVGAL
jgi:hypothetical protein